MHVLLDLIARHKEGHASGVTSICSAHPIVIEASLRHAQGTGQAFVLFEATCNQVNQDGGYTGMTPAGSSPARVSSSLSPVHWAADGVSARGAGTVSVPIASVSTMHILRWVVTTWAPIRGRRWTRTRR